MDDKCDCDLATSFKVEISFGPPPECGWCEQAEALGDACCRELERLTTEQNEARRDSR